VSERFDLAADELYGAPIDEFVPRRDAIARELRAAGERDAAEQVKRLAKPSAPAWVVNRLVRERPDDVVVLLRSGDELRRVQEWLLRGEADPADLRAAVEANRLAVSRLVHAGADVLAAAGRPARGDLLERIGETLHAAAADPEMRAEVERGRVVRDRAAVGLGPSLGHVPAPAQTTRRPASRDTEERAARAASEAAAAREELRAAEAEAKASQRMQEAAERAVERALRALGGAEASWERAQVALREAREELAAAEHAAGTAREAAQAAADEVERRRRGAGEDS
jgi:hypothetical protein